MGIGEPIRKPTKIVGVALMMDKHPIQGVHVVVVVFLVVSFYRSQINFICAPRTPLPRCHDQTTKKVLTLGIFMNLRSYR